VKYLLLHDIEVPYQITKKKNKNTYFYFRKEGFIDIHLSRFQTEQEVIQHMKNHATRFVNKLVQNTQKRLPKDIYYFWGEPYQFVKTDNPAVIIKHENKQISTTSIEQENKALRTFEKQEMMNYIHLLHLTYQSNPYIDLSQVTYQVRHTTSRHGSCNAKKRKINLNANLIHYHRKYLEYVYVHEICHLVHQHHQKAFYDLLEKILPNYRETRKELKHIDR
jgi:predicted metal-dependent hydrolase